MDWIPQSVFEEFLAELAMYHQHLDYVLVKLDGLDEAIKGEYERIEGNYNPEYHDAGDVWYQAAKNILRVDTMFSPHFQKVGAIGGYCIIVYHLFERFLEELCQLRGRPVSGKFDFHDFLEYFPEFKEHVSCKQIDELRLIVNYCKHGKGPSEQWLRTQRPDYFRMQGSLPALPSHTLKPLSGYDLEIQLSDFDDYMAAIKGLVSEIQSRWDGE